MVATRLNPKGGPAQELDRHQAVHAPAGPVVWIPTNEETAVATLTKDAVTLHDINTGTVYRRMDHKRGEYELNLCRGLGDTLQEYDTTDRAGNPLHVVLQIDAPMAYRTPDAGGVYEFTR